MNNDIQEPQDEKAVTKTVVLYPRQVAAVEAFGKRERRNFSNAIQYIIEQWAEQTQAEA